MKTKILFISCMTLGFMQCGSQHPKQVNLNMKDTSDSDSVASVPVKKPSDSLNFNESYLLGRFDPASHADFTLIESQYTTKTGAYLRKDAYEAFKQMHAAAKADGISLKIISATRNFDAQKGIWETKWTGGKLVEGKNLATEVKDSNERALFILRYSSMPGTSRHHWGTDIDINDLNDSYFLSGQGKKEYEWLVANAPSFGFCQPYSPKGELRNSGYEEEKWHWSYQPVSSVLVEQYKALITTSRINGFKGSGTAAGIDVIQKYVLGIAPDCFTK